MLNEEDFEKVVNYAESIFRGGKQSVHGKSHWRNVEANALLIAKESGADPTVVRLFALLHDSCRLSDGTDPNHGPRAAEMLDQIVGELFILEQSQLDLLRYAIHYHADGLVSDEPTIGTCWDADRLDLGRVYVVPVAELMSTKSGKEIAKIGSIYLYKVKKGL